MVGVVGEGISVIVGVVSMVGVVGMLGWGELNHPHGTRDLKRYTESSMPENLGEN